eukprot:TRINITY_DN1115_c0_g1_i3.p1 TRINITY_DN1115_c0_g1~~TRINITY_DN1115_c0_g1_i3.p1  ORF type:complete len:106 (-),score=13.57 TRINITY_DN1115_c0_g1_i3:62-379(-)
MRRTACRGTVERRSSGYFIDVSLNLEDNGIDYPFLWTLVVTRSTQVPSPYVLQARCMDNNTHSALLQMRAQEKALISADENRNVGSYYLPSLLTIVSLVVVLLLV